jgi:hypothetical protein
MATAREVGCRRTESVMAAADREHDGARPQVGRRGGGEGMAVAGAGIVGWPKCRGLCIGGRRKAVREAGQVSAGWSLT